MELLLILLALVLPALLGMALLNLVIPAGAVARLPTLAGCGILLGLVLVPLLMRGVDAVGLGAGFPVVAVLSAVLTVILVVLYLLRGGGKRAGFAGSGGQFYSLSRAEQALFMLFMALLAAHVVLPGIELMGRPLFPFDATMHWATKARVWFEHGEIVPFVENQQWLRMGGEGVFTDHHPAYPVTTPLLQVWMTSAVGHWDESVMNLPWLLCFVGLGLAFYGQLRGAGIGALMSIGFTYLLLSMPLINTHVALAGYADLFLAAFYGAALMAFHNWTVSRETWRAALTVLLVLSCLLIKNEGTYWALTFVPALIVVLMPPRRAGLLLAALLLALALVLVIFPRDYSVAGHSLDFLKLGYRPMALEGIVSNFWVFGNWHLFGYLVVGVLLLGFALPGVSMSRYRGVMAALASALILFLFLFTWTRYSYGAIRMTSVGRISIQLIPGLLFLVALVIHAVVSRDEAPSRSTASTS